MFQPNTRNLVGLSIIEFWERFSFYSLSYLLPLYMVDAIANGGMGYPASKVLFWVGIYGFFAWSSPLVGGILADRCLNLLTALVLGGLMIASGHLVLFFVDSHQPLILFIGLILVSAGTGLFKPSITALVGEVYNNNSAYRERAYSLYYSAINLGILASGIGSGLIITKFGYHWGFSTAGLGMIMALAWFFAEYPRFKQKFRMIEKDKTASSVILLSPSEIRSTLFFSYISSWLWGCVYFLGIGGFLLFLIKGYTDRHVGSFEVPLSWFPSISPLLLITFTLLANFIWKKFAIHNREPSTLVKLSFGQLLSFLTLIVLMAALIRVENCPVNSTILGFGILTAFYVLGSLGEMFTCPISYSLISSVTGKDNIAFRQSICFVCYGLGSATAGCIGAKFFSDHSLVWIVGLAGILLIVFIVMLKTSMAFPRRGYPDAAIAEITKVGSEATK